MATISKVSRKSGYAYNAIIRLRGIKPFSKTIRLRKDAKAWAERMERDIDHARAHGDQQFRSKMLADLIRDYANHWKGEDRSTIPCLNWWIEHYGSTPPGQFNKAVARDALRKLSEGEGRVYVGGVKTRGLGRPRKPATVNRSSPCYRAFSSTGGSGTTCRRIHVARSRH